MPVLAEWAKGDGFSIRLMVFQINTPLKRPTTRPNTQTQKPRDVKAETTVGLIHPSAHSEHQHLKPLNVQDATERLKGTEPVE